MNLLDGVLPLARLAWFRPSVREQLPLAAGLEWVDDYHACAWVDPQTVAIVEPRYHQQNVNDLILGRERALLLDLPSYRRRIRRGRFVPARRLHRVRAGTSRPRLIRGLTPRHPHPRWQHHSHQQYPPEVC